MTIGKEVATTASTTAIAVALPSHRRMPNPIMTGYGAFRAPCTVVLPVFPTYVSRNAGLSRRQPRVADAQRSFQATRPVLWFGRARAVAVRDHPHCAL